MALGKRPKLTLGPRKKATEVLEQKEKNLETRPKLTLGLKKKLEAENAGNIGNSENPNSDDVQRPKLTLGVRRKTEFKPPRTRNSFHPGGGMERREWGPGMRRREFVNPLQRKHSSRFAVSKSFPPHKLPKVPGRLEINIKITQVPNWVQTVKRGWQRFCVNANGQIVQMKVRPRTWSRLLEADKQYPHWVASITGTMGHRIKNGFELLEPAVQIYEKKPKSPDE
jgi:hypothetical protein